MGSKSLKETNPYLQGDKRYYKALVTNVLSSTAIEKNCILSERTIGMVYIVCIKSKSKMNKSVLVCAKCKRNKKCKDYQKYVTLKEKEDKIMEENKGIPMFPVDSKNIKAIGYNANTRTMRVEFHQTQVYYDFSGVPPELFQKIMTAESKGKFFNSDIKGKYSFIKTEMRRKENPAA